MPMNANRSIRARRTDETRAIDCSNYDIDTSKATTCIWREREDTVVTGSMRRRSDTTCIHGMERQQAKMSIALGGEIEYDWGFEGGDMAPRFLQITFCAGCNCISGFAIRERASNRSFTV
jgi:hypothetical protein